MILKRLRKSLNTTLLAVLLFNVRVEPSLADTQVCEQEISKAAERYSVPIAILYAVGLTETGRRGKLHPYALNVEGKTHFAKGMEDAISIFERAKGNGKKLIDLGCMQINHKYHSSQFNSLREMFNPRLNVNYAAQFLRRLKDRHGSWVMAVARYHAGEKNNAAQKRYVCLVLKNMIAQNMARSTPSTRKICGPEK